MAVGAFELRDSITIPGEAQPCQAIEDRVDGTRGIALAVSVFDAQQHLAILTFGESPIEQGGAGTADMQVARGRGGKAGDNGR